MPVSHAPAFDARNRITPAISSIAPALPNGDISWPVFSGPRAAFSCVRWGPVISDGYTTQHCQHRTHSTRGERRPSGEHRIRSHQTTLTSGRNDIEPNIVLCKHRRKLLRHVRRAGLARAVRKVRQRRTAEAARGARDDGLAALRDVLRGVAGGEQRQEGDDAEVDGADVDVERRVEGGRVRVPQRALQVGQGGGGRDGGGRGELGPADAGVGDEEVDVARLFGDVRDDAFQVGLGGCVALEWDDVAEFLTWSGLRTLMLLNCGTRRL